MADLEEDVAEYVFIVSSTNESKQKLNNLLASANSLLPTLDSGYWYENDLTIGIKHNPEASLPPETTITDGKVWRAVMESEGFKKEFWKIVDNIIRNRYRLTDLRCRQSLHRSPATAACVATHLNALVDGSGRRRFKVFHFAFPSTLTKKEFNKVWKDMNRCWEHPWPVDFVERKEQLVGRHHCTSSPAFHVWEDIRAEFAHRYVDLDLYLFSPPEDMYDVPEEEVQEEEEEEEAPPSHPRPRSRSPRADRDRRNRQNRRSCEPQVCHTCLRAFAPDWATFSGDISVWYSHLRDVVGCDQQSIQELFSLGQSSQEGKRKAYGILKYTFEPRHFERFENPSAWLSTAVSRAK